MAIDNPFKITYGSRAVGGSSDTYQLHGPYAIEKTFSSLSLTFDVIVTAASYKELQLNCDNLETDFRKRDQDLIIEMDDVDNPGSSTWTYTEGVDLLDVESTIAKTGDVETDRGYSRAYTCTVSGALPSDTDNGLAEVLVTVSNTPSRQKLVAFQGTYTALLGSDAVTLYLANFDTEAAVFLAAIDPTATFELVEEDYSLDRHVPLGGVFTHVCNFTRQYVELLANQTQGSLDATAIRDHSILFTDSQPQPGDSAPGIFRFRKVRASYTCSVDIDQSTDLQSVYTNQVTPHITALFQTNFNPQVFAVEDRQVSYDETAKKIASVAVFLYQAQGGEDVVEVQQTTKITEVSTIDWTPTHGGGLYDAYVDQGWAIRQKESSRTIMILGTSEPERRIGPSDAPTERALPRIESGGQGGDSPFNDAGFAPSGGGGSGNWHVIRNESSSTPFWIGDADEEQIQVTQMTETVVEQYAVPP